MAQKLTASMTEAMDLDASYTLQFAALDPSSGDNITDVVIANAAFLVTQVTPGTASDLASGEFVPLFVPIPNDQIDSNGAGT